MPQPRTLAPFQFPLRSLFIATVVVAILTWLISVDFWLVLVFPTLPIQGVFASVLGVIYFGGNWRACWLGFGIALVQVVLIGLFIEFYRGRNLSELDMLLMFPVFILVVPAVSGTLGIYLSIIGERPSPASGRG